MDGLREKESVENVVVKENKKEKHMSQYSNQQNQGSTATSPATGVSNPSYNLVSILYHALQAAQTYDTYIRDAEEHGDTQMAQFLRQIQTEDRNRAQYAMQLLSQRASQGAIR